MKVMLKTTGKTSLLKLINTIFVQHTEIFFRFSSGGFTISSPYIESTEQKTGKPHLCAEQSVLGLVDKTGFYPTPPVFTKT